MKAFFIPCLLAPRPNLDLLRLITPLRGASCGRRTLISWLSRRASGVTAKVQLHIELPAVRFTYSEVCQSLRVNAIYVTRNEDCDAGCDVIV